MADERGKGEGGRGEGMGGEEDGSLEGRSALMALCPLEERFDEGIEKQRMFQNEFESWAWMARATEEVAQAMHQGFTDASSRTGRPPIPPSASALAQFRIPVLSGIRAPPPPPRQWRMWLPARRATSGSSRAK